METFPKENKLKQKTVCNSEENKFTLLAHTDYHLSSTWHSKLHSILHICEEAYRQGTCYCMHQFVVDHKDQVSVYTGLLLQELNQCVSSEKAFI